VLSDVCGVRLEVTGYFLEIIGIGHGELDLREERFDLRVQDMPLILLEID
jgi:hypothetical protein